MSDNLSDINIRFINSFDDYIKMRQFRAMIFMGENKVPERAEFGPNEFSSTYILATDKNGEAVGMICYRKFKDFVHFKRMAVREDFRRGVLADALNQRAINECRLEGYEKVYGLCEEPLVPYWQARGYVPIDGAPPFQVENMKLIPICMTLEPYEGAIKMTDHASRILSQEGSEIIEDTGRGVRNIDETKAIIIRMKNEFRNRR